ncbi:MAG TPA: DUF2061 domain-containing protein [Polyangia bacterium]|nr:DUF2061 domain-containing protein [Polyangia bacterium]
MTRGLETHKRSIAKSISWRILAGIITTCVALALTGKPDFAIKIGLADTLTKLLIYYLHERVWDRISFGRVKAPDYEV